MCVCVCVCEVTRGGEEVGSRSSRVEGVEGIMCDGKMKKQQKGTCWKLALYQLVCVEIGMKKHLAGRRLRWTGHIQIMCWDRLKLEHGIQTGVVEGEEEYRN